MKVYLVEDIDQTARNRLSMRAEITNQLSEADIILSRNLHVDKSMIDAAPNLKLIAIHGTGVSEVDIPYAKSKGILVCNSPYQNVNSVAEMNILLALMALRHAKDNESSRANQAGGELGGTLCAILGGGHIGLRTKELLEGFGAKTIVYNRTPRKNTISNPQDVVRNADIVFLTMSLEESNYHFVDTKLLSCFKPGAILVNTARGALVDEAAILKALKEKRLAYYASDVFEKEPLVKTNPLAKHPYVIAFPHIGANTTDSLSRVGNLIVDEIIDFIERKTPKYVK